MTRRGTILVVVCLAGITTAWPTVVQAQTATATLTGHVSDDTEARTPGVQVVLRAVATGDERQASTNQEGVFTFSLLQPGRYALRARRDGFGPVEIPDVVLNVGDRITLRLRLRVAAVDEEVSVMGDAGRLDTSPAVRAVIDRQFVENMPLNGRSFQSLLGLVPGVVFASASTRSDGQFSVNGQRANANYFTVDGVSANTAASGAFRARRWDSTSSVARSAGPSSCPATTGAAVRQDRVRHHSQQRLVRLSRPPAAVPAAALARPAGDRELFVVERHGHRVD